MEPYEICSSVSGTFIYSYDYFGRDSSNISDIMLKPVIVDDDSNVDDSIADYGSFVLDFSELIYSMGLDLSGMTITLTDFQLKYICTDYTTLIDTSDTDGDDGGDIVIDTGDNNQQGSGENTNQVVENVVDIEYKQKYRTAVSIYIILIIILVVAIAFVTFKLVQLKKQLQQEENEKSKLEKEV